MDHRASNATGSKGWAAMRRSILGGQDGERAALS
jgi:hypothetical protein